MLKRLHGPDERPLRPHERQRRQQPAADPDPFLRHVHPRHYGKPFGGQDSRCNGNQMDRRTGADDARNRPPDDVHHDPGRRRHLQ